MGKSLSHLSTEVTQKQNTPGVTTPILELHPEDGTLLKFLNAVATGDESGLPVIQKLKDENNEDLPTDTEYILKVERPTDDDAIAVSVKEDNIASWNGLSTKDQRNEENIDAVKIELKGRAINVRDKDVLTVEINSSRQVDWNNSEWYVPRAGVEEHPFEG